MKLLNDIVKDRANYADRLQQIAEQVDTWHKEISREKRLGLKPLDQMINEADPYNNPGAAGPGRPQPASDTVEFTPSSERSEKPEQPPHVGSAPSARIHLIYNPTSGEIERVVKTPMRSRPPAEFIEATAEQVTGALKHLEKMNPHLADLLVNGRMSVWIPRKNAEAGPSSVKHLGLQSTGTGQEKNVRNMSPEDLAKAHYAAQNMKLA